MLKAIPKFQLTDHFNTKCPYISYYQKGIHQNVSSSHKTTVMLLACALIL